MSAHSTIKRVKEFITLFEKLLKNGFDIAIYPAPERSGLGSFVCSASSKSSQLLDAREEAATAYAEFLAVTYQLEDSLQTFNVLIEDAR